MTAIVGSVVFSEVIVLSFLISYEYYFRERKGKIYNDNALCYFVV